MRKGETQVFMTLGFLGLLFLMPLSGDGADLTISDVITGNGNMTLNGTMSATSFSGSGSGLTNLNPAQLSSGTANINISGTATIATTANSVAANAVTPEKIAFYTNVAVVAPIGGDYTSPSGAMGGYGSWCGTPSETNPCLLKIMPGVYDIGASWVVMQPYIDIEGSGQNVTVITGTVSSVWPPSKGVVVGASNAEIRFLTVKNTGSGTYSAAILNSSDSPAITNVTATASGGANNFGVFNDSSSPTMTNVTATASGGPSSSNYGVYNNTSSSPTMSNVTAIGKDATNNRGVYNASSSPTMTNVTATASGGTGSDNCGVYNTSSSPTMTNVTATASGGTGNYGVYNNTSSSPTMSNVTATGSGGNGSYGVYNSSSSPTMSNVTAIGKDGTYSRGVANVSSSSPTMTNVTAIGKDGTTNNYGLIVNSGSTVLIDRSTFDGSTNSISNAGTVYIGASKLVSAAVGGAGTYHCVGVYKYIALDVTPLTAVGDDCT